MEGTYTVIGLKHFISSLKEGLDDRIDEFYDDHKDNELLKSKEEWTERYKEWTNEQRSNRQRD